MTETPAPTPERAEKKSPGRTLAKTDKKRDAAGRFAAGTAPGPGAPRKDPVFRELCAAERERNIEYLKNLRDDPKADPELRFEAVKLMVAYDAGKPITHSGPQVQVNVGGAGGRPVTVMTQQEASEVYRQIVKGEVHADDVNYAIPAPAEPARAVIDVRPEPVPTAAPTAAPAPSNEAPSTAEHSAVDPEGGARERRMALPVLGGEPRPVDPAPVQFRTPDPECDPPEKIALTPEEIELLKNFAQDLPT